MLPRSAAGAIQPGRSGDRHPTGARERRGRRSSPARAEESRKCRRAAGRRRAAAATRRAKVRTIVVLRK
jgi:hypothetical protein